MKKFVKIFFFSGLLVRSVPLCPAETAYKTVVLESPVLSIIDGVSWGINQYVIANLVHIGKMIKGLQTGTKKNPGAYQYKGTHYTLNQLVELESQLSPAELKQLHAEALEKVKSSILDITQPFMSHANDIKEYIVVLIQDSCKKRNKETSALLLWAEHKKGEEAYHFTKNMTTLKSVNIFCDDLLTFFTDLINSCPKAREIYVTFKQSFDAKLPS